MNIIIFAGGAGTRLWPLSRKSSPKQFEILQGDSSTLQMAVERVREFGFENIYIATNEAYKDIVISQIPEIPTDHILVEPAKRDLAAAVGLSLHRLKARGVTGPVSMLWADHFMDHPQIFVDALTRAGELLTQDPQRFIFLAEKPRFANHNLGWIHLGEENNTGEFAFLGWQYRPKKERCDELFASGEWYWNPGYFVLDIDFVLSLYETHQSAMAKELQRMSSDEVYLTSAYNTLEALSFDEAIIEKLDPSQAIVLKVNLGWSDPGTLYALKEALTASEDENYTKGDVIIEDTRDSFLHNEEKKLVAVVGLDGIVIVNTKDALLVCHKDSVPNIKSLLNTLEEKGYDKYL
jgi:mannose-1-phosphate guanylyltransferase